MGPRHASLVRRAFHASSVKGAIESCAPDAEYAKGKVTRECVEATIDWLTDTLAAASRRYFMRHAMLRASYAAHNEQFEKPKITCRARLADEEAYVGFRDVLVEPREHLPEWFNYHSKTYDAKDPENGVEDREENPDEVEKRK